MGTKHSKEIKNTKQVRNLQYQNEFSRAIYQNCTIILEDIAKISINQGKMQANNDLIQLDDAEKIIKFMLLDPIIKELKIYFVSNEM